jgi:heavy metal translocating P-type ATPase
MRHSADVRAGLPGQGLSSVVTATHSPPSPAPELGPPAVHSKRSEQGGRSTLPEHLARLLAAGALAAVVAGGLLALLGDAATAQDVWAGGVLVMLVPLSWSVASSLLRGDVGVDVIALLAMAGSLVLGQELAGAVIALMLAGGNELEATAGRRARRELTALLDRAPRIAHRDRDGRIEEVPVGALVPGDLVIVRAGDVVPVDGQVESAVAVVDEAALTGEALPVTRAWGAPVRSGSVAAGDAFAVRVTRDAAASAYGQIVKMVEAARADRAPFIRMADRYAVGFLALTLALAGGAWLASGDPVRALAVLVVATPCPLILAAPVAIVAGLARAARDGVVIKDGGALERLGRARSVLLDKTGTITAGTPVLQRVVCAHGWSPEQALRLAASADQLSAHAMAEAIVHAAEARGLALTRPEQVRERPGQGLEATVDGRRVAVGSPSWVREAGVTGLDALDGDVEAGSARVHVGVDGRAAAVLVLGDEIRAGAASLVSDLHAAGVEQVVMASGDRADVAARVGRELGIDRVYSELDPAGKVRVLRELQQHPELRPVIMVGDGVNDAPALALADVGVAMAGAGDTVSSQTADAVILVDRIDRLVTALRVSSRALDVARQSVLAGIGLSLVAMVVAAAGGLAPVAGALLQEGIDVAVILNALRARGG